eukprot:gene11602-34306_t
MAPSALTSGDVIYFNATSLIPLKVILSDSRDHPVDDARKEKFQISRFQESSRAVILPTPKLQKCFARGSPVRKNKIQEDHVEEATAKVVNFVIPSLRHKAGPLSEATRKKSFALTKNASGEARVLGRGGFATVYLGTYLKKGKKESAAISMFFGKDNKHCMGAVGWWLETKRDDKLGTLCRTHIIMLAVDRTLLNHVAQSKDAIGSIEFLGLLEGASRAIRYLHNHDMVHSDVKADNFLIKKKQSHSVGECAYHVKIGDFGLTTPNVKYSLNHGVGGTTGYMGKRDQELASYMRDMYAFGKMIRDLLSRGHLCLSDELYDRLQALADWLVVEDRDRRPDAAKLVILVKVMAAEERKMEEDLNEDLMEDWVSVEADSPPSYARTHSVTLPPVHCHTSPSSSAVVVEKPAVAGYIAALPYCRAAMILRQNACMSNGSELAKGDLTLHVGADRTKEEASYPELHAMGAEVEPLARSLAIQQLRNTPAPLHECQDKATTGCVPMASTMKAARSACKTMRKGVARFVRALLPTKAK